MSIPSVFTPNNCLNAGISGGGMVAFCRTYKPNLQPLDMCEINTQEDYDTYQMGCVNNRFGVFVDNNNNTVELDRSYIWNVVMDKPIHFPIGSRNQYVLFKKYGYKPPYPLFVGSENCFMLDFWETCCPPRLPWTLNTKVPEDKCLISDEDDERLFNNCCIRGQEWYESMISDEQGHTTSVYVTPDSTSEYVAPTVVYPQTTHEGCYSTCAPF